MDETDNILMRTDQRAVAESLAELAEEPFDPRDLDSSSVGGSVGELESDAASVQSLISSDSRDNREPMN